MDLTPASLFANLLVSAVGAGIFLYGKKQRRVPQLVTGLLLMVYPYFVDGWITMLLIGAALVAGMWVCLRLGI